MISFPVKSTNTYPTKSSSILLKKIETTKYGKAFSKLYMDTACISMA